MRNRILHLLSFTKVACIILIFCVLHVNIHSQTSKEMERIDADSLKQLLSQLNGKEKIDTMRWIGFRLYMSCPDSALNIARRIIQLSDSMNYLKGLADGYYIMGNVYLVYDSLYPAMTNYHNALRIYEQINLTKNYAYLCRRLGILNQFNGIYETAITYYRTGLDIFKQVNDPKMVINNYHHIALTYYKKADYDSSLFYSDIALSIADSSLLHDSYWHLYCNNHGRAYGKQFISSGDSVLLDSAITWFSRGLKSAEITTHLNAAILFNLGKYFIYYRTEEMDNAALANFNKAIPFVEYTKTACNIIPDIYLALGRMKKDRGDFDSAKIRLNKTLEVIDKELSAFQIIDYPSIVAGLQSRYYLREDRRDAYKYLYQISLQFKDYRKALEYYIQYQEAQGAIFNEQNQDLLAIFEAKFENKKIENQIATLKRDKHFNELKAQQTRNLNIGIIIAFIILVLVGMLFLRQNKLKNDHKNTLLEQKLLRLQMNPHFIFNALSSIHSLMNPKEVNKASDYLGNFSRLLRTSLESSREDYILLEDEVNSMKNYLELQKLRYDNKFDYKIEVDQGIDLESAIIPPMLIQPFIENAIEHGIRHKEEPGHIHIRFRLDNKKISCEIEDNGIGRDKAWEAEYTKKGKHKSLATEIIRDRINILNKKLKQKIDMNITDLKSEADEALGTMVRLDLPYMLD